MNDIKLPNFNGKILSIELQEDSTNYDLISPFFEMQGNRLFLIGEIPKGATDSNWTKGKTFALAWERVDHYIIFDSLEDYQKRIKISKDYEESSKFNE